MFQRLIILSIRAQLSGKADKALQSDDFDSALKILKQISLNPLDSQAWHLKGVIVCNYDYVTCNDLSLKQYS